MSARFRPIIRVFVSSTFRDLEKERNILQAEVFPALERYCAEREFQFQAIDLRWGVPGEAGLDHRSMRICFDELWRAQQVSPKPNFLVLLSDRYGWQPLPEEISEKEHADLEQAAAELEMSPPKRRIPNARAVLAQWCRRDENSVPPVHLLRSRHESPDGRDYAKPQKNLNWEVVEQVLWAIVNQAYPAKDLANRFAYIPKLSEPLTSIVKFQASATEQEIWRGALAVGDASEHVVAWFRDIREPEQYRSVERAEGFFDREFFQGVDTPRQVAQELRQALACKLGKVIPPATVSLRESADSERLEVTDDHLQEMCCYIQDELTRIIEKEISEYWKPQKTIASNAPQKQDSAASKPELFASPLELRKLELEQQAHERFGAERGANFVGREQELAAIAKYLDDVDRKPLVMYGPSGTGKTALVARAAKLAEGGNHKVITRYLGTTPRCSTLRDLLANLCHELREPGTAPQALPTEMTELQAEFDRLLVAAGRLQPLVLFLDALDQLDPADNAHGTYWLPLPLPSGVKVVVSCLYDPDLDNSSDEDNDQATNGPSRRPARANQPYLSLHNRQLLERAIAVESLTPKQAKELLECWLTRGDVRAADRRNLTQSQWKTVEAHLCAPSATACRRPLYLRVLFEECRLWPSWKVVMPEELGEDTSAQLRIVLQRLSQPSVHGELVSAALGYIAAARRGLSEKELLEVLWADPAYKAQLEQASVEFHHELPRDAKRIPIALWSRLRFDLDPYLAQQAAPGATVVQFYHRQVARTVTSEILADLDRKDDVRLLLARYFEPQSVDARNCDELLWLLFVTESFQDLRRCLLDIDRFLLAEEAAPGQIRKYWVKLKEIEGMGEAYLASFQTWEIRPRKSKELIVKAATAVGVFLYDFASYRQAEALLRKALEISEQLHGLLHPTFATHLNNLARLLQTTNRLEEAEPLMRRALAIEEQSYGTDHPHVAICLNNLSALLLATNRLEEAEPLMRRALAIEEQSYGTDHPRVGRCLNNLVQLVRATNRLEEAEPLMRRALAIYEQSYGTDHPHVAICLNNLSAFLQATNRLEEAEPLVRRALAMDEQTYGPNHPEVATNLNNLAAVLRAASRLEEAEPLMRRALAIYEQSYGTDHPHVAICLNNLSVFLQATNRLEEAEPLMRRALAIDEQSYGTNHPDVALRLNNLARWLQAANRLEEAEPLMRRALAIDEQTYGPDHPQLATNLNTLARLLQATNRHEEAEPLMRRALAIDEQTYGPDHPNVAIRLNNLAILLKATNRLEEAEPLMRRALAIDEQSYGPDHPNVAIRLNNLAMLLKATNRLEEAESLMRRALAIDEQSYGPDHPDIATDLNNLVALLQATNRLGEAEPLMRHALAIDEQSYGPDHPDVARDLNNLAQLQQATNRREEAEPLMRRALAIYEQNYGPDHPNIAICLQNLAALMQATNRLEEAEPLMRHALAIDEQSYGPDHPNVARDLQNLAALLQATNRLEEAEPLMRHALAIDEQSYGPDHPNVARDLQNLAALLQATNRLEEAEPLMRHALAIDEQSYGPDHPNVAIRLNKLAQYLKATNRLEEAEPLMRRALAIDEQSYGPDHPNVAIRLNNLAILLKGANRLGEAEPLMRRHLEIFLKFTRVTGHSHPHLQAATGNYVTLLEAMGHSREQILVGLRELAPEFFA
jgi:tetratricopeptide (TPR) repeat protein